MKLREEMPSTASVEEIFAAHTDQAVREEACRRSGATTWSVSIEAADGGGVRIQVDRALPPDVPDMYKRFVGESIDVRQVEQWSAPDAGGGRRADLKVTIKGQPASMVGTASLIPKATGSTEILEGDVKVNVPFIGGKVEPEIAKLIVSGRKIEQQAEAEWIASNGA